MIQYVIAAAAVIGLGAMAKKSSANNAPPAPANTPNGIYRIGINPNFRVPTGEAMYTPPPENANTTILFKPIISSPETQPPPWAVQTGGGFVVSYPGNEPKPIVVDSGSGSGGTSGGSNGSNSSVGSGGALGGGGVTPPISGTTSGGGRIAGLQG